LAMLEIELIDFQNKTLIGNLLILIMTLLFSVYLVFTKQFSVGLGPFTTSIFMFSSGGLLGLLLIPVPPIWREFISPVNQETWISVTLSIVFGTTIPYMLLNWCLKNTSAVLVSVYTPMELVGTVILSAIFLNDSLTWRQGIGIGGILIGLILVTIDKYREEKSRSTDTNEEEIKERQSLTKTQSV